MPDSKPPKNPSIKVKKPGEKTAASRWVNLMINGFLMAFSSLITLILLFVIGEAWIRSQELPEDTGSVYTIRSDQLPRHILKPNAEEIATGTPVKINGLGFRGREYSREKPEGAKRILVLGDSFAFGAGAPVDVIFPTRMEEMLNAKTGAGPIEVLNLGVSDYNTEDQLAILRSQGLPLSPDLVMVFYVMNDIEVKNEYTETGAQQQRQNRDGGGRRERAREFRDPLYNIVHALRKRSLFLAYLAPRIASFGRAFGMNVSSSSEFYRTAFESDVEGWQRSKEALREIQRLGDEQGFRMALVLFPLMTNFSESYPVTRAHEVIAEFAESQTMPFLDLLPDYMGKNAQSLWVSPTDGHPNAEGHQIAADAVVAFLEAHPELMNGQ